MTKQAKYLFFDLDQTLTPSKQVARIEMLDLLRNISSHHTIIVVSGSINQQIKLQLPTISCFKLGQNGNQAENPEQEEIWKNSLTTEEKTSINNHIDALLPLITHHLPNKEDLIEDRGSQISFSIYGHNAPPEDKALVDPDKQLRRELLIKQPFVSNTIEVFIGGSTCFDYVKKGHHKGSNVQKLIDKMGWNKDECVYFGDSLMSGGNDESVVGVIDTIAVKDETHTYEILSQSYK